ncbi:MAG: hypothetical protein ACYDEH_08725 [Acidimicrobiales bacterium]
MTPSRRIVGGLSMTAPLSIDEERRLYPIIVRGREAEAALASVVDPSVRRRLLRQRQSGQEAESTLLRATCGLVRARVNERGYRFGNEELEAAGVEGLVNALRRFDPARGVRFATYANYWITKLVNQAVQQQAGLTDGEMRLVVSLQRFERSRTRPPPRREIAAHLGVSPARADEIMEMSRELVRRRFHESPLPDLVDSRGTEGPPEAPSWVIDALKRICGPDFDDFWQYTFRTTTLEELASAHSITRQGMAKRIERSRRAVRESEDAERLQAWFDLQ